MDSVPEEPTVGEVMIAVETLRNAGAEINAEAGTLTITLTVVSEEEGDLHQ